MGDGSSNTQPTQQNVTTTTSNIPDYAAPYFTDILQRAQGASNTPYTPYGDQRIAGFNNNQTQVQNQAMGLQSPGQYGTATQYATQAGLGSVSAPQFQYFQQANAPNVTTQNVGTPTMGTAQTSYNPQLQQYQMAAPEQFGSAQAQQYMSPYTQNVLDIQKQQAIRDAQKDQLASNLGAAYQGTYGGARQLLASTERERALGSNLANIEATGLQSAYNNAQQQFNADRGASQTAQQANLQANLQTQGLGTQTGLQSALANLSAEQQANVQNQAAQLQTQGLNAQQALQAALANQQAGITVGSNNLNANVTVQNQSAQAQLQAQMANQQAQLQAASTLGQLGGQQQQSDLARLQAQSAVGTQQQQLSQQQLDQAYQDFLTQQNYPQQQISFYNSILHGLPITPNTTTSSYAPAPSTASQLGGLGLGALGLYNMAQG